jgi:acyl carrier protein
MIPSVIIQVPKMPMTLRGKIDKEQLLKVNILTDRRETSNILIEPQNNELFDKFTGVLKDFFNDYSRDIESISLDNELIEIGVDSIRFVKLIVLLEESFDIRFENKVLNHKYLKNLRIIWEYIQNSFENEI